MNKHTNYETPVTELTKINLEQGFLVDSINQDDSGIPDLGFTDLPEIGWTL